MTDAQIRYLQSREQKRHNVEQEKNWQAQLQETFRSNMAHEALQRYATEVNERNAQLQAATQRFASELSAQTQRYATDTTAGTQRYSTDTNASTQRYAADQKANATKYSADTSSSASKYKTDIESADRAARLEFDKATQEVKNRFEKVRVDLAKLDTMSNARLRMAQISKIAAEAEIAYKDLAIRADRLGLDQEAAKYTNELNRRKAELTEMQTYKNAVDVVDKASEWVKSLWKWLTK